MGGQPRKFHLKLWLEPGFRSGRADGWLQFPQTEIELAADLRKTRMMQPEQLGMQNGESEESTKAGHRMSTTAANPHWARLDCRQIRKRPLGR